MTSPNHDAATGQARGLDRFLSAVDRLCRLDGWLGALCLTAMTCLILAEVFVRFVSNFVPWFPSHIPVAWEYGSYLMAAAFTFGSAMTLRSGGHIRVNLLLSKAGKGLRRALEIGGALIGMMFTGFLTYAMINFSLGSLQRGTTAISSDTPLWIPQILITFGIGLLALQFMTRLVRAIAGLPLEDHSMRPQSSME